jgi:2-succinyl-6-hydroxy-2,4-cyclohexadiene-1-carboxylate synthase
VSPQTLHLDESGAGPPLLALHGFTGGAETWQPIAAACPDLRLLAVDLPGHGRSPLPPDPAAYRIDATIDALLALLDARAIDQTALLGYSLGGRIAMRLALSARTRVRALILESASPGIADPAERAKRFRADAAFADRIEAGGIEAFVDEWERLPLWRSQGRLPNAACAGLRAQRLRNATAGLAGSLRGAGAGADPSVLDRFDALPVPLLLIAGALDQRYCDHAAAMAKRARNARVEVVEGAGHAVHLEQPDRFAQLVRDFLAEVERNPSDADRPQV